MNAVEASLKSYRDYILDFQKLGTFKVKLKPLTLKKFIEHYKLQAFENYHGIYLFCEHGKAPWEDDVIVYYIGQTKSSIVTRVCAHFKALVELDSTQEATGRSFEKAGINRKQKFDVWFIQSEILGIVDHETSIMSEKAYQHIFNVVVKDAKYSK